MAKIRGDRVVLDEDGSEPFTAWAILYHGHTRPDLIFASEVYAETYRSFTPELAKSDIVPVLVSGNSVSRVA